MVDHATVDHTGVTGGIGAWTDYTPSLTGSVSNPTLGSSTLTGRYALIGDNAVAIHINFQVTTGGAWNAGSGNWVFSIPAGMTSVAGFYQLCNLHVLDNGTAHYSGVAKISGGQSAFAESIVSDASGSRILSNSVPVTWATGDQVNINGIIEIQ